MIKKKTKRKNPPSKKKEDFSLQTSHFSTPRLRFPEFRDKGEWEESTVGELITTISPPKKLTTSQYLPEGRFPVIDQSPDYQCGWTNDDETLIDEFLPLIVFGDHTCVLKLVNQPFAQGADGIKIFRPKRSVSTEYLYHFLCARPLVMESYKRHFSILKGRQVFYPEGEKTEQKKIAECLSSLDGLIAAEGRKLEALKVHKKGLMQQLFPQPGETMPRLRFPEFRDKGEWDMRPLGDICERIMDGTHFSPKTKDGPRPYLTSKNIRNGAMDLSTATFISEEEHRDIYKSCPVRIHDVLLTKDGASTGNCTINTLDYEFSLLSSVAVIRGNSDLLDQRFLYQTIASDRTQQLIARSMSGQAITRITLTKLGEYLIAYPSKKEQQRIASCLSSLDDWIASQSAKIETLKQHKRGLMQQLFPSEK